MSGAARILLVDDHAVLRAGLRALLDSQPGLEVVGEAEDGRRGLLLAERLRPDLVLLDINMPGLNGLELLEALADRAPECRALVLTMHDDAAYVRQVLEAGGAGYVLKQAASDDLLRAIRSVLDGGVFLAPEQARQFVDEVLHEEPDSEADSTLERYHSLSGREAEVMRLVVLGHPNREIAEKLHLSVKTVETYKKRMMDKLGLKSRVALVRFALDHGLVE